MRLPAGDTAAVPGTHGLVGPYCIFIGGDDWRKNLEGMVRGFAAFHRDHPDHQLAIVCTLSSDRMAQLRQLTTEHSLPDRAVTCTGYVSTEGLVRHATMLVYPSLYEGLGLPVLEAYGCGVPAVGSATSSVVELVIPELALTPPSPPRSRRPCTGSWPNQALLPVEPVDDPTATRDHGRRQATRWCGEERRACRAVEAGTARNRRLGRGPLLPPDNSSASGSSSSSPTKAVSPNFRMP